MSRYLSQHSSKIRAQALTLNGVRYRVGDLVESSMEEGYRGRIVAFGPKLSRPNVSPSRWVWIDNGKGIGSSFVRHVSALERFASETV